MKYSLSTIRWLRIFGAALAVIALSFLILTVITTAYAFVLAFKVRGAPDQTAINSFAQGIGIKLMLWLEVVMTFLAALIVTRRTKESSATYGLFIGAVVGLLSLALSLAFGGRISLEDLVFFLIVIGLGWLGGFVGQKRSAAHKGIA